MKQHRYILQPYRGPSSRIKCPQCGRQREFARYLDTETSELLPDYVGRCNREQSCGYHFSPKEYFAEVSPNKEFSYIEKKGHFPTLPSINLTKPDFRAAISASKVPQQTQFLPLDLIGKSMTGHNRNGLAIYLESLFGATVAQDLISKYMIGTSRHWKGATAFWQIDEQERVRQCKVMLYNSISGRRVRGPELAMKWDNRIGDFVEDVDNGDKIFYAGKQILQNYDAHFQQCLYGQHLLAEYPKARVGLVESEKTALIASVYFPRFIWLATGGKYGARWTDPQVCKALAGREVVLFPDLGQFEVWSEKAKQIRQQVTCNMMVSDILENVATDEQRAKGWDLADYLVTKDETFGWALSQYGYPVFWDYLPSG